jgi:cob(I)alamin adenosyltransferase
MSTKIYTKTGDGGQTAIIGGKRVSKSDARLCAYGTIDELNAHLGICRVEVQSHPELARVEQILGHTQNDLFAIGSLLACADKELAAKMPRPNPTSIYDMETHIDTMTNALPELKEFILPGGTVSAAQLHVARTVCRRAEREVVYLLEQSPSTIDPHVVQYLNRLGDYLFVAARYCNQKLGVSDVKWHKG